MKLSNSGKKKFSVRIYRKGRTVPAIAAFIVVIDTFPRWKSRQEKVRAWWRVRVKLSEGGKQTVEGDKGRTCCPSPPSSLTHTGAVGSARCKSASLHSSGERGDVRDGKEKINWAKCACCCLWSQSFLSPSLPAPLSHYFLLLCNPATFSPLLI